MKTAPISVTYIDHCGSDLSVVNAARVSFAKESEWEYGEGHQGCNGADETRWLSDRDTKLIYYLANHKHTSPFNHCFLSFRVKAPIFVARQLVKHKFLPWNEVSRRYVDDEPEFYFPEKWRGRAMDKKQGSAGEVNTEAFGNFCDLPVYPIELCTISLDLYTDMLVKGYAPEQARMFLPQNTLTEWIWSGTLGAWCDMLRLRLGKDTQEETREVAKLIASEVQDRFPVSYEALLGDGT